MKLNNIEKAAALYPGGAWARANLAFVVIAISLLMMLNDAFVSMAAIWLHSSAYHHGLFAAPIAFWLIWRRRDWRRAEPRRNLRGALVIAAAFALFVAGRFASLSIVEHFAFALAIAGAIIFVYGGALARQWGFALAFLFFMVPFGEEANPALQSVTSHMAAAMLNASGIETARDGLLLSTSNGRFEIAASCSGLRFLLASAMISILLASLSFQTARARFGFILSALVAAFIANWLRAYVIIAVTTLSDRRLGLGPEHVGIGWAIYAVMLLALIVFARRHADPDAAPRAANSV
ncbi:MAG: exosortase [Parvularculaceae bacterium]|nr:exosortase [Parvularculaceae bacterium]